MGERDCLSLPILHTYTVVYSPREYALITPFLNKNLFLFSDGSFSHSGRKTGAAFQGPGVGSVSKFKTTRKKLLFKNLCKK